MLKEPVLNGDAGLSQKSSDPGNASYYYSITRLETTGRIRVDGEGVQVSGLSWLDREWSTSALAADQVGWDWFALQLADHHVGVLFLVHVVAPGLVVADHVRSVDAVDARSADAAPGIAHCARHP